QRVVLRRRAATATSASLAIMRNPAVGSGTGRQGLTASGDAPSTPAYHPMQPRRAHQPPYRAARRTDRLTVELAPNLSRAVDAEILCVHALHLGHQGTVALQPRRQASAQDRLTGPCARSTARGDRQLPAG